MEHSTHPLLGPPLGAQAYVSCKCGWSGHDVAAFYAHRDAAAPAPEWHQWVPPSRPRRPAVLADELRRLAARLDGPEYLGRERLAEIAGGLRTVAAILDGESA